MVIASLRLELRLIQDVGLWRKRRLIRSIVHQVHKRHNVSIAEVDRQDHPTECVLGVVAVGTGRREVRSILHRVAKILNAHPRAELTGQTLVEA